MTFTRRSICRLAVGAMLLQTAGCSIFGAIAAKTMGPPKIPPEYAPPKDQPLVVIVENYRHPADLQQPADQLAMLISSKLEAAKVAPIVPADKLVALRTDKGPAYDKMKIPDIGRAVGAKQVIYVNLRECSIEGVIGADDVRCNVDALVKVVDVETGQTKWPGVGDGKEFPIHSDYNRSQGRKTEEAIRDQVLDNLSDGISQLFYTHQPEGEIPND